MHWNGVELKGRSGIVVDFKTKLLSKKQNADMNLFQNQFPDKIFVESVSYESVCTLFPDISFEKSLHK